MPADRTVAVHLTGGLGNQLFQLAAGLAAAQGGDVTLLAQFGLPRRTSGGLPDICDYLLPPTVRVVEELGLGRWRRRAAGASIQYLMSSTVSRGQAFRPIAVRGAEFAASKLCSTAAYRFRSARAARGGGFDERILATAGNTLLVGYMQSWRFAYTKSVLPQLQQLRLRLPSSWLTELELAAAAERPLIVHIRLGDYRGESQFGLPSAKYVDEAISQLRDEGHSGRVWLFSDEPEEAAKRLPEMEKRRGPRIVVAPPVDLRPALVLQALRLGTAYVLANSTFGYWGALLSGAARPTVIYPDPWFRSGPEMRDLIPPSWTPKDSRLEDPRLLQG